MVYIVGSNINEKYSRQYQEKVGLPFTEALLRVLTYINSFNAYKNLWVRNDYLKIEIQTFSNFPKVLYSWEVTWWRERQWLFWKEIFSDYICKICGLLTLVPWVIKCSVRVNSRSLIKDIARSLLEISA